MRYKANSWKRYNTGISELYFSNKFVCRGVVDFEEFPRRFVYSKYNVLMITMYLDIDLSVYNPLLLVCTLENLRVADSKTRLSIKSATEHQYRVEELTMHLTRKILGAQQIEIHLKLMHTMIETARGLIQRLGWNRNITIGPLQYVDDGDEEDDSGKRNGWDGFNNFSVRSSALLYLGKGSGCRVYYN